MEQEKWRKGGWIRCTKSGYYNQHYIKGECYQLIRMSGIHAVVIINREEVYLSTEEGNSEYGLECEWVGMDIPHTQPAYWW